MGSKKPIWPWSGKRQLVVWSTAAGTLALTGLLFAVVSATQAPSPAQTTARLSYSQQVTSVAGAGFAPVAYVPPAVNPSGFLPVVPVDSVDFMERLSSEDGRIFAASIDPTTHVVAYAGTSGEQTAIVGSVLLGGQLEQAQGLLASRGVPVNVLVSSTSRTSVYSRAPGLSGASSSGGPAGQGVTANPYASALSASNPGSGAFDWSIVVFGLIFVVLASMLAGQFARVRRAKGAALSSPRVGARKGKVEPEGTTEIPRTRFSEVAGCEEAVEDMRELVAFIKEPERFTRVGVRPPRGALLVGPPGTGKTLLARALAGEAGVPFFAVSGSDFVEMYVGVGAKRVRELFEKARKHENGAIIFIDEIDAVGRQRAEGRQARTGGNVEGENTLNALLVEMDGFLQSKVIVIGATNRDDILDPALVRPGRLDRKIAVPLPDRTGRLAILKVHATGKPLAKTVDLELIARRTPGMSGAELAQLVNEACLSAARARRGTVTDADFDNAVATVTMGKARTSAVISEEDRELTAWHEAGHALCGLVQPDAMSPVSISIIPRGQAGGVTHFPARDSGYMSRKQAYAQLVTAMGGMAAEQMLMGWDEFTTGPSGDLDSASNLALSMVTRYGMGERLVVKSETILGASSTAVDEAVAEADALMRSALADAKSLLETNGEMLHHLVEALLEFETLTQDQIVALVDGRSLEAVVEAPPAPRRADRAARSEGPSVTRVTFGDPDKQRRGRRIPYLSLPAQEQEEAQ